MNTSKEVAYRQALAVGFLREAEQDYLLERWRSCVDNAQLTVENVGKTTLALFGIVPKTHDPARQIAVILQEQKLPKTISTLLHDMLPDLLVLGSEAHFLTDYGDESSYTLPWDLFTKQSAESALKAARQLTEQLQLLLAVVEKWRTED